MFVDEIIREIINIYKEAIRKLEEAERMKDDVVKNQIIEENKEFEAIDLEPTININYSYEVIGDKSICSDILFTEKYEPISLIKSM